MKNKSPEPILFIDRWITGLVTQRNPLTAPFSYAGLNVIKRNDALINGSNMELSNSHTLVRRGGLPRYCSTGFGANEFPLAYSAARINGAVVDLVDTNQAVYSFTTTSLTSLFSKGTSAQSFFQQRGNFVYISNGVDAKKWNGGSVSKWGITAPANAPTFQSRSGCNFWTPSTSESQYTTIIDSNGSIESQVNSASPVTTGTTYPVWNTYLLHNTNDGSVAWSDFGPLGLWQPSTTYNVNVGTPSLCILDTNNNVQRISSTSGGTTSGATQPSWNASLGGTVVDNNLTWQNIGPGQQSVYSGVSYVYSYHTIYGHVSTASPASLNTGPVLGPYNVTITGAFTTDTQCDFVWIFRTKDGGSTYYFLGQVANNSAGGSWTLNDISPDSSLNTQIIAPLAHANDPPPAGMTLTAFHMNRVWGAVGSTLVFGNGPDTITGVADECFPPANTFNFPSSITGLAPTSQGLVVFTKDQMWVILGGPQALSFYPQQVLGNLGISSPNCLAQDGDQFYIYTTSRQFFSFSLNGKSEDGFAVGDTLSAKFNPATSYLALHRNGQDVGVFLSDGVANIIPYNLNLNAWGTLGTPAGGIGAIGSIETAFGTYTLCAGRPTGAGFILGRSTTSFLDDGQAYSGFADVGSMVMSTPGSPAQYIECLVLQYTSVGGLLKVGVLPNEVSGNFIDVPYTSDDPYETSGTVYASKTLRMRRHDWSGIEQQLPNSVRHMQVRITLPTENAKNEILSLSVCPQIQ